jgi:hypothetical protein
MPLSNRTLTRKRAATYERLDSDALFHKKPLSTGLVFSLPNGRSPLRVSCSSRFISRQRQQLPALERPCRFGAGAPSSSEENLIAPSPRGFGAFPTSDLKAPLPVPPTCPSFSDLPHYNVKEPGTQRPTARDFQLFGLRTEPRNPKTP